MEDDSKPEEKIAGIRNKKYHYGYGELFKNILYNGLDMTKE
jgi:hypothetical protein